ncbi:MAG: aldehyde ferredoxin oxidoreductase family protein [Candidatus Zipacnadales bacterium]
MYSYTGRILHIDLTTKKSRVQHINEDFLKKYVGGVGLATRLAYDNTPKGVDPLGPDNALCFACSAFGGTIVPVGTKHGVASKSPLTGFIADSLASSYFSQTMRRAGYDGIVIKGRAEKPTWIFIDDDLVEFRDAADLWGKGCFETEELIRQKIGDETVRVSSIGVAGENLIRFASIGNDRGRQAGRCGNGAVMGSKNLKAIAIRGSHPIRVADLGGLKKACLTLIKLAQGSATEKYRILGTPANVLALNRIGVLPTRNFQQTTFEGAEKVSGEYMHEHFTERAVACSGCQIACEQVTSVREGPYTGARTSIDYETLYALGPNCGIDYFPAIIKLADQCDHYGMDTLSTGVTVAFAMECYQRGVLTKEDFDGLEMEFGNHEAAVALVDKIAHREGIGAVLAEGVKRASAEIGKGSEKWAMHVKGLEMCGYDPRSLKTFAVGLAVGTRGGCHNRSLAYEADIKGEVDRFKMEKGRGKVVKEKEEYASLYDIVMLCKFLRGCFKDFHTEVSRLYTMTTGIEMTPDDLRLLGERVCNLKKAFNIREGWTKEDDWLPPRFTAEPIPDGPAKGHYVTPEELRLGIDDYYEARGWTKDGLIPKEKLIELGLEDIAEEVGV